MWCEPPVSVLWSEWTLISPAFGRRIHTHSVLSVPGAIVSGPHVSEYLSPVSIGASGFGESSPPPPPPLLPPQASRLDATSARTTERMTASLKVRGLYLPRATTKTLSFILAGWGLFSA